MNYTETLQELIKSKKEIADPKDVTVVISVAEIADIWNRKNILGKKDVITGYQYLDNLFLEDIRSVLGKLEKENLMKIKEGVLKDLSSLDDKIFMELKPKNNLNEKTVTGLYFDDKKSIVYINGSKVGIPIGTNLFYLCKYAFSVPFGDSIKEIEIRDMKEWSNTDSERGVYDALNSINKKIEKITGIKKLFIWKKNHFWIDEGEIKL